MYSSYRNVAIEVLKAKDEDRNTSEYIYLAFIAVSLTTF